MLNLPDAVFRNGANAVADIAVYGFTDTGDARAADVAISGIWVSKQAIDLRIEPPAISLGVPAAQQNSRVRAVVHDGEGGLVPDGTEVNFRATGGTITESAQTVHGIAETAFTPDDTAGTALVWAEVGFISAWGAISKIDADEPLVQGGWILENFDEFEPPEPERMNAETSFIEILEDEDERHPVMGHKLHVHYAFQDAPPGQVYLQVPLNIPVPGRPTGLRLSAESDGNDNHLTFIFQDAEGTFFTALPEGRSLSKGERVYGIDLEDYDDTWGANANGVIDYPVTIVAARHVRVGGPMEGDFNLKHISAEGLMIASELEGDTVTSFVMDRAPRSTARYLAQGQRWWYSGGSRGDDGLRYPPTGMGLPDFIRDNIEGAETAEEIRDQLHEAFASPWGRFHEAQALCDRIVELDPETADWHRGRARLLYKAGRFEDALTSADRALELSGEDYVYRNWTELTRALCLDGLGRRDEAVALYERLGAAIEVTDDPENRWYHRAGPVEAFQTWCEAGVNEPVANLKRAPNSGPEYAEIHDKSEWLISASRGDERVPFACDNKPDSVWTPGGRLRAGDWYMVDMGEIVLDVARIVLDDDGGTSPYPWDITPPLVIEGSVDGETWEELGRAKGHPINVIDVTWEPRPLRCIRATLTEEMGENQYIEWRIYETYVYQRSGE